MLGCNADRFGKAQDDTVLQETVSIIMGSFLYMMTVVRGGYCF